MIYHTIIEHTYIPLYSRPLFFSFVFFLSWPMHRQSWLENHFSRFSHNYFLSFFFLANVAHPHGFRGRGQHLSAVHNLHQREISDRQDHADGACLRGEAVETHGSARVSFRRSHFKHSCFCFFRGKIGFNMTNQNFLFYFLLSYMICLPGLLVRPRDQAFPFVYESPLYSPVTMAVFCAPFTSSSSSAVGAAAGASPGSAVVGGAASSSSSAARSATALRSVR